MQGFPLVLIFLNSLLFLSVKRYIPPNIPLVDDNSEFNLLGYKNFLLEPKVRTVLRRFKEENLWAAASEVQRCTGTTAGLGYLKVLELSTQILLPNGGKVYNSSTDPNKITSEQLQCIQDSRPHLADKTTSKPQPKYCTFQSSPYQPPYCIVPVPIYEINIQKEWHWPPNIYI